MKRGILIVSILSIIFLIGCGSFNLDGWIWPDDDEFIVCIEGLNTPRKISIYMLKNFTYEVHTISSPSPYILWKTGIGDCSDMATFGIFASNWHGGETYYIIIFYINDPVKHMIAVYVEDEGLSFSDNQTHSFYLKETYFDTFREIVEFDCEYYPDKKLKSYIVYDYWDDVVEEVYKN